MTKVFALGGSVIEENWNELEKLADALEEQECVVVTGAGSLKKYMKKAEKRANQSEQEEIGVRATRLNAELLKQLIPDASPVIPESLNEVATVSDQYSKVVMGGLMPGFSTDAVAALVAERLEAELILLKDVDGVYDKDPSEPGAEKLDRVSSEKLLQMKSGEFKAAEYGVVDSVALKIIDRSDIKAHVMEGTPSNLEQLALSDGTEIT